jgi:hypothetical protein
VNRLKKLKRMRPSGFWPPGGIVITTSPSTRFTRIPMLASVPAPADRYSFCTID